MTAARVHDESVRRAALSIGVLEDRVVVREGLRVLLERSPLTRLEWVSSTLNDALVKAPKRPIDALLVSVDLGGESFKTATSRLRRAFGPTRLIGVVVDSRGWVSRVRDHSMIDDQLSIGDVHPAWIETLKLDRHGDSVAHSTSEVSASCSLTNREHEVLTHLVRARDNRSIAYSLGIAEATVKRHVSSILRKFGSKSRAEASLLARELGYAID